MGACRLPGAVVAVRATSHAMHRPCPPRPCRMPAPDAARGGVPAPAEACLCERPRGRNRGPRCLPPCAPSHAAIPPAAAVGQVVRAPIAHPSPRRLARGPRGTWRGANPRRSARRRSRPEREERLDRRPPGPRGHAPAAGPRMAAADGDLLPARGPWPGPGDALARHAACAPCRQADGPRRAAGARTAAGRRPCRFPHPGTMFGACCPLPATASPCEACAHTRPRRRRPAPPGDRTPWLRGRAAGAVGARRPRIGCPGSPAFQEFGLGRRTWGSVAGAQASRSGRWRSG